MTPSMEKKKQFRFPRGTKRLNIPFLLNDWSSWKEQVEQEIARAQERMGTSKSSWWGYVIENGNAHIYVSKI